MLRKLRKRIKGQSTLEYAILLGLVVGALIAMQTYTKRALQARIKDATDYMVDRTGQSGTYFGNTQQYEPYYLQSNFEVTRTSDRTVSAMGTADDAERFDSSMTVTRTGSQEYSYNADQTTGY